MKKERGKSIATFEVSKQDKTEDRRISLKISVIVERAVDKGSDQGCFQL